MTKKLFAVIFIILASIFVANTCLACEDCYRRHGEYRPGVVRPPMYEYDGPEPPPHYRRCGDRYSPRHGGWGRHHRRPRARIEIEI